jgi:hypothetical protein
MWSMPVSPGPIAETIAQVGRIQGMLLGSVAMKVIHLAEVPITLLK